MTSASKIMADMASDPDLQDVWADIVKDRAENKTELDFDTASLARGEQGQLLISVNGKVILEIERTGEINPYFPYITVFEHSMELDIEEVNK